MNEYMKKNQRFEFKLYNGMIIGPDGCHYETEAEAMYYGQINLCGCGQPTEVHRFLLECLAATSDEYKTILDHHKIAEIIKSKPEIVAEFVLHFLDNRNLTEHGGSVYGSWLTERGKQILEIGVLPE